MKKIVLDKEILYQTYITDNNSMEEAANKLGVCVAVVRKNIAYHGIAIKPSKNKILDKETLQDLYQTKLLSIRTVGKILNVPETQVRTSLKFYNIERRTKSWKSSFSKNGQDVPCAFCGKMVYRKRFKLNKFDIFFCSWHCEKEYQSFIRSSDLPESWRRRRGYKKWRKAVLNRDGSCCKLCGSNVKVVAHHIIEAQDNIELRYETSNGITLCQRCHIDIHRNKSYNYIESLRKAISVENPNIGETPEVDNPEAFG